MLVIHWAKHNITGKILANGIHPTRRRLKGNIKGVYVYPFAQNKTLIGTWRRNLKTWDRQLANFNGFVFRLTPEDFPLFAGLWFLNRSEPEVAKIDSMQELTKRFNGFLSGDIAQNTTDNFRLNAADFEIIIPHRIAPERILRVIKDREPPNR